MTQKAYENRPSLSSSGLLHSLSSVLIPPSPNAPDVSKVVSARDGKLGSSMISKPFVLVLALAEFCIAKLSELTDLFLVVRNVNNIII